MYTFGNQIFGLRSGIKYSAYTGVQLSSIPFTGGIMRSLMMGVVMHTGKLFFRTRVWLQILGFRIRVLVRVFRVIKTLKKF